MDNSEQVVLVHGLGGRPFEWWPLHRRLSARGYQVRKWAYRSVGTRIEQHVLRLTEVLTQIDRRSRGSRFHLVTHSLGGIVVQALLGRSRFENLGRVVMLAPPHRGSHIARRLAPYLGWLVPALSQLSDAPESFVNRLPNPFLEHNIELGIVAAVRDRVIAPAAVQIAGARDMAWVDGHHGLLPWYSDTIRLVEQFLTSGSFSCRNAEYRLDRWQPDEKLAASR